MTSLPMIWIVVICLLVLVALASLVLLVLKSREAASLKNEVLELRDTMRMMRYEEANLARMLHTVSRPVEQLEESLNAQDADESGGEEATNEIVREECSNTQDFVAEKFNTEDPLVRVSTQADVLVPVVEAVSPDVAPQQEEALVSHPCKQSINERRPAIPTDLFSAWFAENEDVPTGRVVTKELSASVETETDQPVSEVEGATEVLSVVAVQKEKAGELSLAAVGKDVSEIVSSDSEVGEIIVMAELSKEDERFCRKLERVVNARLRNPNLNVDFIAAQFGIGRTNFYRKVRELTGMSPNDYLRKCRMERATELLGNTEATVSDVCAQVGMPDAQYFSRVFKTYYGISPSQYREKHNNQ